MGTNKHGRMNLKRELFERSYKRNEGKLNEEDIRVIDLTESLGDIAKECAVLELQNHKGSATRALSACLELDRRLQLFKLKIRAVKAEVNSNK
jgi:hypothetical protein